MRAIHIFAIAFHLFAMVFFAATGHPFAIGWCAAFAAYSTTQLRKKAA